MDVREQRPADEEDIRRLHLAAFGDHGRVVAGLVDGLQRHLAHWPGLSLVAVDGSEVVGHVLFSRNLLDAPPRLVQVQVLSPLAVLPARQGQGIGSALVRRGVDAAAARGVPLVFLEGPPSYYSRLGFRRGDELGFRKPSLRIPDDAFQVLRLPSYEPWMTGTLVYAEVFWENDAVGLRDDGQHDASGG